MQRLTVHQHRKSKESSNLVIEANPYRVTPKVPTTVAVALNETVAATANSTSATTEATNVSSVKPNDHRSHCRDRGRPRRIQHYGNPGGVRIRSTPAHLKALCKIRLRAPTLRPDDQQTFAGSYHGPFALMGLLRAPYASLTPNGIKASEAHSFGYSLREIAI